MATAIEKAEAQNVQGFIYPDMAKAAIATVLREMIAVGGAGFTAHYFVRAFAAEHNIAIGEGKEGDKDGN